MTTKDAWVRLPRAAHARGLSRARESGTTVPRLYAELIEQYAAGPVTKRPAATPQSELALTRVPVEAKVLARAKARAAGEGKALADAVAEALMEGEQ